jgi:molybdopterin synthase sulfur carrier subunit
MVKVRFPRHLRRHVDLPAACDASGETVADVVRDLERQHPGVTNYLLHEDGRLRQHVNIFLDNRLLRDRRELSDRLEDVEEVFVMQALSGG